MKYLIALVFLLALNSCNTCIGLGRDIKHGYQLDPGQGPGNRSVAVAVMWRRFIEGERLALQQDRRG